MPAHLNALFSVEELQEWDQDDGWPYGFTKGCKIMKIPSRVPPSRHILFATMHG